MQKVRGHSTAEAALLPLFVGTRFQVYFTPLIGVLFTFPSRYLFTIGHRHVLSLGRWSSQIPPGFHVSQGTQESSEEDFSISRTGVSPSMPPDSAGFHYASVFLLPDVNAATSTAPYNTTPTTPARLHWSGLGWSPFARRY